MRYPLCPQLERDGCADSCFRMLREALGGKGTLSAEDPFQGGLRSMGDIMMALKEMGITSRAYHCHFKALGREVRTPAVVRLNGDHLAVLWEVHRSGSRRWFLLSDPSKGRLVMDIQSFLLRFAEDGEGHGYALWVEGIPEAPTPRENGLNIFKGLGKITRGVFVAGAIWVALQWVYAPISKVLLDHRIGLGSHRGGSLLLLLVASQGVLMASRHAASALKDVVTKAAEDEKRFQLEKAISRRITDGPTGSVPPWRISHGLVTQLLDDSARIGRALGRSLPSGVMGAMALLGILGALWAMYPPAGAAFTMGSLLMGIWNWWSGSLTKGAEQRARDALLAYREQASEVALSAWDARDGRIGGAILRGWETLGSEVLRRSKEQHIRWTAARFVSAVIREGQYLAGSYITALGASLGDISIGKLLAAQFAAGQIIAPMEALMGLLTESAQVRDSTIRLEGFLDPSPPRGEDGPNEDVEEIRITHLELRGIRFKYLWEEVLKGVDLTVHRGEAILIMGPSGCGKSTLLKLAAGLMLPTGGQILAGGIPVTEDNVISFRRRVSWVLQESRILSGSLLWNVSMEESPDQDRLVNAIEAAGLSGLVRRLPQGLLTKVGPRGLTLSRGESQRVLLARCIYGSSDLLVLDEATSSLDATTETTALREILSLPHRPMVLMTSHSSRLMPLFHQVLELEGGFIKTLKK